MTDRGDHLEHLPSRTFLGAVAIVAALATVASATQLASSSDKTLWGIAVAVGALALLAVGVAWEERRAHVHALVREALEETPGVDPVAELMRMGAHREADYVRTRVEHPSHGGSD